MVDIAREINATRINLCLDCGKCTVVCPVARHDPGFNPRLIAQRRLSQNNLATDPNIWSCVNCYMCVERCNYHVSFPTFIQVLRAEALQQGDRLQYSHGAATQAVMHLMARPELEQKRLQWLPEWVELPETFDTAFFVGCAPYFDVVLAEIEANVVKGVKDALYVLKQAKVKFGILANERCCGRDLLLQGDREGFMALARANVEEFARHNVKRIITNCPECHYTLKVDYPKMLKSPGIEVLHLSQVIAPLIQSGELKPAKIDTRVTYHDPCTLGRCLRIFEEPRQILAALSLEDPAEMELAREKALCCGASPWVNCGAVNRAIQEQRLGQAAATGAEVLVTSCPKCQIHLKCAQRNSEGKGALIQIRDLASLAAESLGGESVG